MLIPNAARASFLQGKKQVFGIAELVQFKGPVGTGSALRSRIVNFDIAKVPSMCLRPVFRE